MTKGYDTQAPFIASFVILRKDGKIAFVLRTNTKWMNGYYGLPSGKVENNESFLAAAVREGREEAGVELDVNDLKHIHTVHRHEPSSHAVDWVDLYFEATAWEGEPYNAEPHMHGELTWIDPNNLPENTIPSVKAAFAHMAAGKPYSEYGWSS